ncbi:DUF3352 domain-containing protein [Candidatus Peregrinibacteria bacterium]|nr:DUF3352 domain-containing protein [Candidatus Peregrinibacteria bacterium]
MFKKKKKEEEKPHKAGGYKQKVIGLVIGLIAVFLLVFIIYYTVSRIFRPEDLANFLPQDTTFAVVQVSTNTGFDQVENFYKALNKYEIYQPQNIVGLVNDIFDIDYENEVEDWLGRQVGMAFLENPESAGEIQTIFFIEVKDAAGAVEFMKSRGLKEQEDYLLNDEYNGIKIYRYALSQAFNFAFIKSYIVIASNQNVLKSVIDATRGGKPNLKLGPLYQKISQNIPIKTLSFVYLDLEKLIKLLKSNSEFMGEKGRELLAFEPLLKIYKGLGAGLIIEKKNIVIQTYTCLDENYLNGKEFIGYDRKFRGGLLKMLPKDIIFYSGGKNLRQQLQRYSEIFSAGGEVSYLIFEGLLNAQKNIYFGNEISLEEDIYPLLENEYALALTALDQEQALTVVLELSDPIRDKDKIAALADSFVRKSALLAPKVVEVTLEDGTVTKEVQTTPEEITKSSENYKGYEINALNISNQTWGVYYIILDKNFIMTTKLGHMQKIIDLYIEDAEDFTTSDIYTNNLLPVLNVSDEVIYYGSDFLENNFKSLLPEYLNPYLSPVQSVSSGNNYFKDGISSINYLKVD